MFPSHIRKCKFPGINVKCFATDVKKVQTQFALKVQKLVLTRDGAVQQSKIIHLRASQSMALQLYTTKTLLYYPRRTQCNLQITLLTNLKIMTVTIQRDLAKKKQQKRLRKGNAQVTDLIVVNTTSAQSGLKLSKIYTCRICCAVSNWGSFGGSLVDTCVQFASFAHHSVLTLCRARSTKE